MTNKVSKSELNALKKNKDSVDRFSNGEITVFWKPELCIHSANCLISLPGVFNTKKHPWINIHGADSLEIMRSIDRCPSRALTYLKNSKFVTSKSKTTKKNTATYARIQVVKNGPLLVSGNFLIRDIHKKKIKIDHPLVSLCRCGKSRKKPFCDGNHHSCDFKD